MESKRPVILVVEDDLALRNILFDLLDYSGYGVVHAADGREGLARIESGGIDLVLLDLMLPDVNGLQLCQAVRERENTTYLPIIMLTALSRQSDQQAGFAAGADDYIRKPFDTDDLLSRVQVWIRTSQRIQRQQAALVRQASLLDLAPDGIFVRELNGRTNYWSAGAEVLYRWSRREALGVDPHVLLRTEFSLPREEIESRVLRDGSWTGELVQTRRDGSRLRVVSRWAVECDDWGHPLAILELNTDVTEREALADAERRYTEARLESTLLAGRELAQLLNDKLELPPAVRAALLAQPDLSPGLRDLVTDTTDALDTAAQQIARFRQTVGSESGAAPFPSAPEAPRAPAASPC